MWRLAAFALLALCAAPEASAQGRRGGGPSGPSVDEAAYADVDPESVRAFVPRLAEHGAMIARGFVTTGLVPVYPQDAICPTVNSPFASTTRGDGSPRQRMFFLGYHGGIDIPVPEGTPVLAVAAGKVVHKSPGESIGGIGLVLQHAPEDTGFAVWLYTEYKHLAEMPKLELGARVKRGEAIAISGRTGTESGHYGPSGHPHLHLTAWFAATEAFDARRIFVPKDGHWMDPLALFRGPPADSPSVVALPAEAKRVAISYVVATGVAFPTDAKIVWPLACARRS